MAFFTEEFTHAAREVLAEQSSKKGSLAGHIDTAYSWHGGGGSPLYSFASTGGKVHTQSHKDALVGEIDKCIGWCNANKHTDEAKDVGKLTALRKHVSSATPVGEK